jgi:hypothetical protein
MTLHHLLYALLFLALFPFYSSASFVLQVPVKDEHCFVLRVPPNSLVSGNWYALDDHLPVAESHYI